MTVTARMARTLAHTVPSLSRTMALTYPKAAQHILFNAALHTLTQPEWEQVREGMLTSMHMGHS